jgi:hypothetical protein
MPAEQGAKNQPADVDFQSPRSSFSCWPDAAGPTGRRMMRVIVLVKATEDSEKGFSRRVRRGK